MQQQAGGQKGNKRLTEQTVMRQRQILTRLLEAEKSARERDLDDKREAQTAQAKPPVFPPAFCASKNEVAPRYFYCCCPLCSSKLGGKKVTSG